MMRSVRIGRQAFYFSFRHPLLDRVQSRAVRARVNKDDWGDWTFDTSAFKAGTPSAKLSTCLSICLLIQLQIVTLCIRQVTLG
jgi:hypothetical protein